MWLVRRRKCKGTTSELSSFPGARPVPWAPLKISLAGLSATVPTIAHLKLFGQNVALCVTLSPLFAANLNLETALS